MKIAHASVSLITMLIVTFIPSPRERVFACASCGAGGGSPIVLYPNETLKAYLGISTTTGYRRIMRDGQEGNAAGPDRQDVVSPAFGWAPDRRLGVVLTTPYVTNRAEGQSSHSEPGDPLIELRFTAWPAAWDRPWAPQVQVVGSYKHSVAGSIYETEDPFSLLDVVGNGFNEITSGADVWWGMAQIKPGLAAARTWSLEREVQTMKLQRGPRDSYTGSITVNPVVPVFATIAATQINKSPDLANGVAVANSESRQLNGSLATRFMATPLDEVRVTYLRTAVGPSNREAVRSTQMTVGYAKVF